MSFERGGKRLNGGSKKASRLITNMTAITPPVLLVALVVFASCSTLVEEAIASPDIIYSDSQDGWVNSLGFLDSTTIYIFTGDTVANYYFQGFVKFGLSGISGTVSSARLYLYVYQSSVDGTLDTTDPLQPPDGLGDCLARHIADYGTLDISDLDAPSIGNDPGVLLTDALPGPNVGYLSIDVTTAMQDDINNGRSFSSFMIKMFTDTDDNDDEEGWWFYTSEQTGISEDPYIEYALGPAPRPVGGVLTPVNKLDLLAPYLALICLVGAVTIAVAAERKRRA